MIARGDLNYIITAPTDKEQMIGPLQAALDAGIKIITVDTFLGDGDYVNGPVKFPISYIGSDNVEGGRISARGLAKAIGGKGTVYINSTNPNVSSVEGREKGFEEVMAKEFPDIKVIGPDYNLDDQNKATQQTAAVIEQHPDLAGVFGTNVFSAQGAGNAVVNAGLGGHVQVVAYDATKDAIEMMNKGVVSLVLAQKPFDMGYMAVEFAVGRRRRRHQPAEARRDRLCDHRQGQRQRPELSPASSTRFPASSRQPQQLGPGSAARALPAPLSIADREVETRWPVPIQSRCRASPARRRASRAAAVRLRPQPAVGLGVPRPDDRLLRHRGAAHQRRLGQLSHHPQFAEHPGRDHADAPARPRPDLRHHLRRHRPVGRLGDEPRLGALGARHPRRLQRRRAALPRGHHRLCRRGRSAPASVGFINGVIIAKLKVPAFIVTLGTLVHRARRRAADVGEHDGHRPAAGHPRLRQ